ncbi:MAG: hypothetical protein B7Z02_09915 [Rhodobacterales bacterium 32-67-9]|nr:MAG: hypothetical protein B7Z02_09915 [Rhodobacterales bacterium 32-67-9]
MVIGAAQIGPNQNADSRATIVVRMLALLEGAERAGCTLTAFLSRCCLEGPTYVDGWFETEMPNAATRLAAAPAAIECRPKDTLRYAPERDIVVGEAVALAARDALVDTARMHVDWEGDFPVARLFADRYARLEEIGRHAIPQPMDQR